MVLLVCGMISIATTLAILFTFAREGWRFFQTVNVLDYVTGTTWAPKGAPALFGVLPLLGGTVLVSAIALLVAVPLGLGAATYLSEYAGPRLRKVLKPLLELLAGIPTVVFGYFALTFVTPQLRHLFGSRMDVSNALSAGLVMGIMITTSSGAAPFRHMPSFGEAAGTSTSPSS